MKSEWNVRSWQALRTCFATVVLLSGMVANAHATRVKIDPTQSSVTYFSNAWICDDSGACSPAGPQTFQLSGNFDVTIEHESIPVMAFPSPTPSTIELDLIRFKSVDVDAGDATTLGFDFPAYPGVINGEDFSGSESPCFLFFSGSCSTFGVFGTFAGTFDGTTLSMTGSDPNNSWSFEGFQFAIVAQASEAQAVPEPGTLACVAAAILGMSGVGLRRRV